MKLVKAQIKNFRCVEDSGEITLDQVTCLVGKNESGKTSILRALERYNSTDPFTVREFDREKDWPRNRYEDYRADAVVLELYWVLEEADVIALEAEFGTGCLSSKEVTSTVRCSGATTIGIRLIKPLVAEHLFKSCEVDAGERELIKDKEISVIAEAIEAKSHATLPGLAKLLTKLKTYRNNDPALHAIDILLSRTPKILYFESYDRMSGRVAIENLQALIAQSALIRRGDRLFLTFLEFAETTLENLTAFKKAEEFFAKLEGKGNIITKRVFKYWRQNRNLEVRFSITDGRPDDSPPFNGGKVFHTRIYNRLHQATVNFDERSAGFTWFFSFLVHFSQIKQKYGNVIILLDEPGLSLHGKAQDDLLRFIDEELKPHHQVIYTTHSPFMVPPDKLETVRIVEDVVVETNPGELEVLGTKVSTDVLAVTPDTLFPLQAALGYEISKSLWVGPHVLLVEGPSDILFLQAASLLLKTRSRTGLDTRWTPCPSGGMDKIGAFLSLFAGNRLNVAVLLDFATGQKGKVEQLRKSALLQRSNIFTTADFTPQPESDVEDFWGTEIYIFIVNQAFKLAPPQQITSAKLMAVKESSVRVAKRVEAYFRENANLPDFDHFTPADWLLRNTPALDKEPSLEAALKTFEKFFQKVNTLLPR